MEKRNSEKELMDGEEMEEMKHKINGIKKEKNREMNTKGRNKKREMRKSWRNKDKI